MMESAFEWVSQRMFESLHSDEHLTLALNGESSQFIRFNQSKVRQIGLIDDAKCTLILKSNQRQAQSTFPFTGNPSTDGIQTQAALKRLRAEVAQLPEDPYLIISTSQDSSREVTSGNLLPKEHAVEQLLPAMQGTDLAGIWASGNIYRGNANSEGQKHWFSTETFSLDYSLIAPNKKMVKATFAGTSWDQKAYENQIWQTKDQLKVMESPPKQLTPGQYRTYLAPAAVADLLGMFSWKGISESALQQGTSALGKMRHEGISLSPKFNLTEDFRHGTVPRFNEHGEMAPKIIPLIVKGQLQNTLISSRTAQEYNLRSNYAADGEYLRSPQMEGGNLEQNQILSCLHTGLFLSNLHYLNWSDPMGGRITGMTRYACFWVENGQIVAPIENMRFDDSLYRFFGEKLEAVSQTKEYLPEIDTYEGRQLGGISCSGIVVNAFELTL